MAPLPRPDRHPAALASPGAAAFDDQRLLLLELLVDPPPGGDPIAGLARALDRTAGTVEAAAAALVEAGLAERDGDRVRASAAALAFDLLWPVRL